VYKQTSISAGSKCDLLLILSRSTKYQKVAELVDGSCGDELVTNVETLKVVCGCSGSRVHSVTELPGLVLVY
jgi:hypothetical protein